MNNTDALMTDEVQRAISSGWICDICEACCANCGEHFPPFDPRQEKRSIYCAKWDTQKSGDYFCRAWKHERNFSAGIAPDWCEPYTKRRLTEDERKVYYTPDNVRKRLQITKAPRVKPHLPLWALVLSGSINIRTAKEIDEAMDRHIH